MTQSSQIAVDRDKGNFRYDTHYEYDAGVGINEDVVRYISEVKEEDEWILNFRLKALKVFNRKPLPTHWASKDLENIHFDKIRYYLAKGQQG